MCWLVPIVRRKVAAANAANCSPKKTAPLTTDSQPLGAPGVLGYTMEIAADDGLDVGSGPSALPEVLAECQ